MIGVLLPKADPQSEDAADALAIAICHAHHRTSVLLEGRRRHDRQTQRHRRQLRRGLHHPRRRRRRLSGALLGAHPAGAAGAGRSGDAVDRDLCARRPDQAVRFHQRHRARMVPPVADRAGRRRQGRAGGARHAEGRPNSRSAIAMRDKAMVARTPGVGAESRRAHRHRIEGQGAGLRHSRSGGGASRRRARREPRAAAGADAVSALVNLGYGQPQAAAAIAAAARNAGEGADTAHADPAGA